MTVIHAHDTLPPIVTEEPVSYDGCTGLYWDATPEGAAKAIEWHHRNFPDREVDAEVLALSESR